MITYLTYGIDYTIEQITAKQFRVVILNNYLLPLDSILTLNLEKSIIKSLNNKFLTGELISNNWEIIESPLNLSFMSNNFIFNPSVDGSNLSFMTHDLLIFNPSVDGSNLSFMTDTIPVPATPTISKVGETVEISGTFEVYYTFNALSEPADPDKNSDLYTVPLAFIEGYYKAISYNSVDDLYSLVASEQLTAEVVADYVAFFKFDGNTDDETGIYTATNFGATLTSGTKGIDDTAYLFDGTSNYMNCNPQFSVGAGAYNTISLWVKRTTVGNYPFLLGFNSNFGLEIYENYIGFWTNSADIFGCEYTNQDSWNHFVIVTSNGVLNNCKIYINNVLQSLSQIVGLTSEVNIDMNIGFNLCASAIPNYLLDGTVDNVRCYDRELNVSDINLIYNSEKPITIIDDYIAFYKTDDNLATTNIIDETTTYNATSIRNTDLMSTIGVKGVANTAFALDGSNDYFYSMIGAIVNKSYSFWFQIQNTVGNKSLIYFGSISGGVFSTEDAIAVIGSNLRIYCYDGSQKRSSGTTNLSENVWYHCICTFVNNGNCYVYLNGLLEATLAINTRLNGGDRHWFGKDSSDDGTGLLNGRLDNLRIYDRVLIQDEITQIYNTEKP